MKISILTSPTTQAFGAEVGYRMIREAGFEAVDLDLCSPLPGAVLKKATQLKDLSIYEGSTEEILAYLEPQLCEIKRNGLQITQAHAPFPPDFPDVPCRSEVVDYLIAIYGKLIEVCEAIGCPNLIIHGFSKTIVNVEDSFEDIRTMNWHMYESLIPTLQKTNVTVCLENLFTKNKLDYFQGCCADPHEAVEYIDKLNEMAGKECFGLCLDTGHLHLLRGRFGVYAPILGKRIKALHVHDNDMKSDQHLLPYSGSIAWEEFTDAMHDIGYDRDLSFECDAQIKASRVGASLVPVFLRTIYEIGDQFRHQITE